MAFILMAACYLDINSSAFDVIATFLSITTGFTITALSIVATSPFSKQLYSVETESDNSKTLLHELVSKFRTSTYLFISAIGLIIIHNFLPIEFTGKTFRVMESSFSTVELLNSVILYFTILCFYAFAVLFHTFAKFVTKTATKL